MEDSSHIPSEALLQSAIEIAPITPEQAQILDTGLLALRDMEYTYATNPDRRNSGPQFDNMQPILEEVIPTFESVGKAATPYLIEALKHPNLPEKVSNKHGDDPNLARSDMGRFYTALFLDGQADGPQDIDPIFEAFAVDTINFSAEPRTPTVLLDTIQRLTYPARELVEQGTIPADNPYLSHVTDELIALYDATPPEGIRREDAVTIKLLDTLTMTGTTRAKEFVQAHLPDIYNQHDRGTIEGKIETFNPDAWRQLKRFEYDPEIDMENPSYRLKRTLLNTEKHQALLEGTKVALEMAEKPADSVVTEPAVIPVEDPVLHEAKESAIKDELSMIDNDENTEYIIPPAQPGMPPPPTEITTPDATAAVAEKPVFTRRGILKAFVAAATLAAAGLSFSSVKAPAGESEQQNDPDPAPTSLPIPEQPGKDDAILSESLQVQEPIQGVPTEIPEQPGAENVPLASSIDEPMQGTPAERPEQPGADTAPMATNVEEPIQGTRVETPAPFSPDLVIEKAITLEDLLAGTETIAIGEGSGTISEAAWTEAKKDADWWRENYWYKPENMGAFTLANYDVLKASYEAKLDTIPEDERYPDGYPTPEDILTWTTQAKNELMKIGMSNPTEASIATFERSMTADEIEDQLSSLDNLWHASWWVREGDSYRLPRLSDSSKILDTFRA